MSFKRFMSSIAPLMLLVAGGANVAAQKQLDAAWANYSRGSSKRHYVRGNSIAKRNRHTGLPHFNLKENARRLSQLNRIAAKEAA